MVAKAGRTARGSYAEPRRLASRVIGDETAVQPTQHKGREPALVAASIRAINGLRRYDQEAVELDGQQAAYQPSGNGISGQGARLSLAARGG